MKIYTRTGDDGTTALFGGKRIAKDNPIVEAYGTVDELTSYLGIVIEFAPDHAQLLTRIQKNLYKIMASVSGAYIPLVFLKDETILLEDEIDKLTKALPPLRQFVLPQGSMGAAYAHVARTVCRRAERRLVATASDHMMYIYINRLSDYLFTLARTLAQDREVFA